MKIKGQQIDRVWGGEGYNAHIIYLAVKDEIYKMKVDEILKFNTDFNNLVFNVVEKRVWKYLEVA